MHFRFALELSDIDFWNIDLLDTHLNLLDTDIPSKSFVCLDNVFKTSWRHVFKTSSRRIQDLSSKLLEYVFSLTTFRLPRRLEDVLLDVFKRFSRPLLCKTSSRRPGGRKIVTLKWYTLWNKRQVLLHMSAQCYAKWKRGLPS